VKLRGRTEAPAHGAEGAQFLSARGDNIEAPHGPLQRLLGRLWHNAELYLRAIRQGLQLAVNVAGECEVLFSRDGV